VQAKPDTHVNKKKEESNEKIWLNFSRVKFFFDFGKNKIGF